MQVNKIIRKSHYYCEDRIVIKDNLFLVMDGATPLVKDNKKYKGTSASYFVTVLKKDILKSSNIYECLFNSSKRLYKEFNNEDIMPSCGMSFVQILNNKLITNNIGDCEIFIKFKDGTSKRIVDTRLIKLDQIAINEYSNIRPSVNSHKEAIEKIGPILIKNRNLMNKKNGYDVYCPSKDGIFNFNKEEYELNNINEIYLYSDGLAEAVETLKIYKDFNEMFKDTINVIVNNIINVSNNDKECIKYPRFKRIDDISVIHIKL